jgi:hypothetical protein
MNLSRGSTESIHLLPPSTSIQGPSLTAEVGVSAAFKLTIHASWLGTTYSSCEIGCLSQMIVYQGVASGNPLHCRCSQSLFRAPNCNCNRLQILLEIQPVLVRISTNILHTRTHAVSRQKASLVISHATCRVRLNAEVAEAELEPGTAV